MISLTKIDPEVSSFLRRAVEHNRLAHAYLFLAEDEEEAVNTAFWLACLLNCQGRNKPDGTCVNCRRILSGNHPDLRLVKSEGRQTLSIDQIRPLKEELAKNPVESGRRFFFIEHAEKLTLAAANALLNLLEEPEAPVVTILISQNAEQILPTIRSRSQLLTFSAGKVASSKRQLLENGLDQTEIQELGETSKLDQQLKYFYQELRQKDDLALLRAHQLSTLKQTSSQKYVFIRLKLLAQAEIPQHPQQAAALLEKLMQVDQMRLSNVSFRNCLDYLVLSQNRG